MCVCRELGKVPSLPRFWFNPGQSGAALTLGLRLQHSGRGTDTLSAVSLCRDLQGVRGRPLPQPPCPSEGKQSRGSPGSKVQAACPHGGRPETRTYFLTAGALPSSPDWFSAGWMQRGFLLSVWKDSWRISLLEVVRNLVVTSP